MRNSSLFNSPIELGLRSLILLHENFPNISSLQQLVAMDYLLIHSADVEDGPESIHPNNKVRGGEYIVKREAIYKGVLLFVSYGLIDIKFTRDGFKYSASEAATPFIDSLIEPYVLKLIETSVWVAKNFGSMSEEVITKFIHEKVDKWGAEFATESGRWEDYV